MGQFDNFIPKVGLLTTGNRAYAENVVVKKPKPKVAGAGAPPPQPPRKNPNTDKK